MTPAERIKQRRLDLGMSQEDLALKVGYSSRTTIAKIETNANNLRQNMIAKIADALEVTPSYIMGWEDPVDDFMSSVTNAMEINKIQLSLGKISLEEYELISKYRKADDSTKAVIDRLLN